MFDISHKELKQSVENKLTFCEQVQLKPIGQGFIYAHIARVY